MTSQLDAKGLATYFFYDALGRLSSTRDNNYKLIKQYEYNYKHE
jgi:YD repeat-containing protein